MRVVRPGSSVQLASRRHRSTAVAALCHRPITIPCRCCTRKARAAAERGNRRLVGDAEADHDFIEEGRVGQRHAQLPQICRPAAKTSS